MPEINDLKYTINNYVPDAASVTGAVGGFVYMVPHPVAKVTGKGLLFVSAELTVFKHINNTINGNFNSSELAVDVILNRTQVTPNKGIDALYDEIYNQIINKIDQINKDNR